MAGPTAAQRRHELQVKLLDGLISVVYLAVICATILGTVYLGREAVIAYAGRATSASIAIRFLAEVSLDKWLAYLFGAGGIAYGYKERRGRQKTIERLADRPGELEKRMHPERTSSGLTPRGTTQPRDK